MPPQDGRSPPLLGLTELLFELLAFGDIDDKRYKPPSHPTSRQSGNADENRNAAAILTNELFFPERGNTGAQQLLNRQAVHFAVFGRVRASQRMLPRQRLPL